MKVIIDRFEGKTAVCEKGDRTMVDIPRNKLPSEAKEGDVLEIAGNDIQIDFAATARRRKAAQEMMRGISNNQ